MRSVGSPASRRALYPRRDLTSSKHGIVAKSFAIAPGRAGDWIVNRLTVFFKVLRELASWRRVGDH